MESVPAATSRGTFGRFHFSNTASASRYMAFISTATPLIYLSIFPRNILTIPGRFPTIPSSCTTIAIPCFAASAGECGAYSSPFFINLPESFFCIPHTIEASVDFPEPFSPASPRRIPFSRTRLISLFAKVGPKLLLTPSIRNISSAIILQPPYIPRMKEYRRAVQRPQDRCPDLYRTVRPTGLIH